MDIHTSKETGSDKMIKNRSEPVIESENAPTCPYCGTLAIYLDNIDWIFRYKPCHKCGKNYLVRKTAGNTMYETKKHMDSIH